AGAACAPAPTPPVASFTFGCGALNCAFDASGSTDDSGITSYSWNFGDGQTGSGVTANHTYASAGTFTVLLTVTDTGGQSNTTSRTVTVSGGGSAPCPACTKYRGALSGAPDYGHPPG